MLLLVVEHMMEDAGANSSGSGGSPAMASQLLNVRLKLEEKRRHIESEKRKMELMLNKQRQRVGKAAFLQAVTKVCILYFLCGLWLRLYPNLMEKSSYFFLLTHLFTYFCCSTPFIP